MLTTTSHANTPVLCTGEGGAAADAANHASHADIGRRFNQGIQPPSGPSTREHRQQWLAERAELKRWFARTDLGDRMSEWLGGLAANNAKRNYKISIEEFGIWLAINAPDLCNDPAGIKRAHVNAYLDDLRLRTVVRRGMEQPLAPKTIFDYHKTLKRFMAWLADEDENPDPVFEKSPMKGHRVPRGKAQPVPVLTDEQIRIMLESATDKGRSKLERLRDEALLRFLRATGVRVGELVSMSLDRTDLEHRTAVVTGKTGTRIVAYDQKTASALRRWIRHARTLGREGDLVVRSEHGRTIVEQGPVWVGERGPLTVGGVYRIVRQHGKAAGVWAHPHMFRHTFAYEWLDNGGNETDLQTLAGWSDIRMVGVYVESVAQAQALAAYRRQELTRRSA